MAWTHDQERLAFRMNALLRAWKDYGLPLVIDGGRRPTGVWFERQAGEMDLFIRCEICQAEIGGFTVAGTVSRVLEERLAEEVLSCVSWLARVKGCTHLTPMLAEPPPEVWALFEMNLLTPG